MARNVSLMFVVLATIAGATCDVTAGDNAVTLRAQPALESIPKLGFQPGGFVGARLRANLENWELRVPDADPALLAMFYDRERKPGRNLLPWSGEFVGKYLCASILSYRILRDPRQKALIERVTNTFIATQGPDGYLGPFDASSRLTGKNWDVWGHYWAMRALLMYYREFGSPEALRTATRAGDLLVQTFLNKGIPLTNDESYGQMNYAVIHAFTDLYRETGKPEYLEMSNWIVNEWDKPGAGLYMRLALAGKEMYEFPGNRWESLQDFLGMYEMYLLTADPKFRQAFTHIWSSIVKGDRHNTGGATSGEHMTGNPYDKGTIETCSSVAWMDMSVAMLKLTGDSRVADELELSTFNGNLGGQNPAGNWWTFTTPMDGTKEASAHTINFQCRAGSPDLNCCSVNGPRGLGLVADWALMRSKEGVALNYYGPSLFQATTPGGQVLRLIQETDYPVSGKVIVRLGLSKPETLELKFRVPVWSAESGAALNNMPLPKPKPGNYLSVRRDWKDGDTVSLDFDMTPHFWVGERESFGLTSIYQGPILLAFDPAYNTMDPQTVPEIEGRGLKLQAAESKRSIKPWLLVKVKAVNGQEVTLCDFATAGAYGNFYRTWLPIRNVQPLASDPAALPWTNRPN
jgi:hypothetical protein